MYSPNSSKDQVPNLILSNGADASSSTASGSSTSEHTAESTGSNDPASTQHQLVQTYLEDAIFAVQNGNKEFLELLLGPNKEELKKGDDELAKLAKERITLTAKRHAINTEVVTKCGEIESFTGEKAPSADEINIADIEIFKEYIKNAEKFSVNGGTRRRMEEAYEKNSQPNLESMREHDRAYRTEFVNGKEQARDPIVRKKEVEEYEKQLNQYKISYFLNEKTQAELQNKTQKLNELISSAKQVIIAYEAADKDVNDNAFKHSDAIADRTQARNDQISSIKKAMSENPQDMPMPQRYKELLNLDNNKTLNNLLVLAAGARVSVQEYDQAGKSLLYCALEMEKPRIDILELLLAHGAAVTLLDHTPRARQPYKLVLRSGNNEIARLFIDYHMRGIAKLKTDAPGFMDNEMLLYYMGVQLKLLKKLHKDLTEYYEVTLPETSSLFSNDEYKKERMIIKEVVDRLFAQAIAINSWFIVGEAIAPITVAITKHTHWWTGNRSRLKSIFEKYETEANTELDSVSSWHLIVQLQEIMTEYKEATSKKEIELRVANEEIMSLRMRNEALEKALAEQKNAMESKIDAQDVKIKVQEGEIDGLKNEKNLQEEINRRQAERIGLLEKKFEKYFNNFTQNNQQDDHGSGNSGSHEDKRGAKKTPLTSRPVTPGYDAEQGGPSSDHSQKPKQEKNDI